jgi:hypothetical protein
MDEDFASFVREQRAEAERDAAESRERLAARLASAPVLDDPLARWGRREDTADASERAARREDVRRRVAGRVAQRDARLAALEARVSESEQRLIAVLQAVNTATTAVDGAFARLVARLDTMAAASLCHQENLTTAVANVVESRLRQDAAPPPSEPGPRRPERPRGLN